MKTIVPTIDRFENLGIPHTACPLVHPLPKRVPMPTKNPDKNKPTMLRFYSSYSLLSKKMKVKSSFSDFGPHI
jgi:hypothetical protein